MAPLTRLVVELNGDSLGAADYRSSADEDDLRLRAEVSAARTEEEERKTAKTLGRTARSPGYSTK
jgi:hypothetical protein